MANVIVGQRLVLASLFHEVVAVQLVNDAEIISIIKKQSI